MADETIIEPVQTPEPPKEESRANERITQLSEKVKTEAEAREKAEKSSADAEKRAQFAEGYADFALSHPTAKEFKAQIQEKVLGGMSVEDAGFAVLGKAGKLGVEGPMVQPAGGSASTTPPQTGQKQVSDMTQAERREELAKQLGWT